MKRLEGNPSIWNVWQLERQLEKPLHQLKEVIFPNIQILISLLLPPLPLHPSRASLGFILYLKIPYTSSSAIFPPRI
jgi:hypothetical protein